LTRSVLALGTALAAALAIGACGGDDSEPADFPAAALESRRDPADLVGRWRATQQGGVELAYGFRPNGTYTYSLDQRQKRRGGTARFTIAAQGTFAVRGSTLKLKPRRGTKMRRDPDEPERDYVRPLEKFSQTYRWSIRGDGTRARLTITIGTLAIRFQPR